LGRPIGIDLGLTGAVMAVLEGSEPVLVANAEGSRTTPSVVAFARNSEVLVGEVAKRQADTNVNRTICSIQRHMGTDWAITIDGRKFTPQQISAFLLEKLKRDAEAYLGETITDAVITVPSLFKDAARQATKEAGQIAGLNVLRIINEPMAAALAFRLDRENGDNILVFDLGAQALNVALLEADEGLIGIRAASGDNQLGGDDWDHRIVNWLVRGFKNRHGVDLTEDRSALQRLRESAEKAKIELSGVAETTIDLPYITHCEQGPLHLDTKLTRAGFQKMTSDLLDRCKAPFQEVIEDARADTSDIDHVVLVSDATQMPAVVDLVNKLTGGKEPCGGIRAGEVVAIGTCLQAGILLGEVEDFWKPVRPSRSSMPPERAALPPVPVLGNRARAAGTASSQTPDKRLSGRRVFLVHGRDHSTRDALATLLKASDLKVIHWRDAAEYAGGGTPYTGDIVAAGMANADAVVVLLTPDDMGYARPHLREAADGPHEREPTGQARLNVVFEAGMAIARDRDRVVLVEVGQVRKISDVEGLNLVRMDGSLDRRKDFARRLRSAGLSVDTDSDEWRAAGSFYSGRLTSPSDGSEVNHQEAVSGMVTGLRPGTQASLIVYSPRSGHWPQAELLPDREGRFRAKATFGKNRESYVGKDYALMLILADQNTSASLQESRGHPLSILPPDVRVLDQATVIRRRLDSPDCG
jgi:predicted nucleotide-binding protein/actin-like ATPase involved in cell morphogenesis